MRAGRLLITTTLSLGMACAGIAVADIAHAASATRYVELTGDDGARVPNDCTDQANPCATIQHAITEADAGDTVQVGKGTFHQFAATSKDLTLQGAGAGATVIDGASGLDGASVAVLGSNGNRPAVTVRDISLSDSTGTGLLVSEAQARVIDAHLDRNKGAGVYVAAGKVSLVGSTASGNVGTGSMPGTGLPAGIGIVARDGDVSVDDSVVDGNGEGGVILTRGSASVTNSTVSRNAVDSDQKSIASGFGIVGISSPLKVSRSTVSDNGVGGIAAQGLFDPTGGGTPAPASTDLRVSDSTLSGNEQVGIVAVGVPSFDVDTSTVSGNGIGIYGLLTSGTVRNATIAGTTRYDFGKGEGAPSSAGLYYREQTAMAGRAAVTPAFVPRAGVTRFGKLALTARPQAQRRAAGKEGITVSGTALDQTGSVPDCIGAGNITDAGYNLSADAANSCGFSKAKKDLVRTAAKLGALADNSGTTATQLPAASSPALGVIPVGRAGCVDGATDQRGLDRRQGARCDIGAVERALAPVRITTKSVPHGQVGERYRKALAATGGDGEYVWALAPGSSLPAGLTLSSNGVISGTPKRAGTYEFSVLADGAAAGYTLVVDAAAAGPDNDRADPIAETGAPSMQLTAWGSALVALGLVVLLAAGHVGRRPGRHRPTV